MPPVKKKAAKTAKQKKTGKTRTVKKPLTAKPKAKAVKAKPLTAKPKAKAVKAKPRTAKPKAKAVKAKPRTAKPKAKAVKAKPRTAKPKVKPAKVKSGRGKLKETPEIRKETIRRFLVQKREQFVKETQEEIAKYIKGENRQLVETALDDGDWSIIDLSEDINLRKLGAHRQTLLKIDEAIRKLKEDTYGICEDCGEEIDADRLKILPFAIYCKDCQEKREELEAVEKARILRH